jgi:hypothetical protein
MHGVGRNVTAGLAQDLLNRVIMASPRAADAFRADVDLVPEGGLGVGE